MDALRTAALLSLALPLLPGCGDSQAASARSARAHTAPERLACPGRQGALQLAAAAPDGRSCIYSGPEGARVKLWLTMVPPPPEQDLIMARRSLVVQASKGPYPAVYANPAAHAYAEDVTDLLRRNVRS